MGYQSRTRKRSGYQASETFFSGGKENDGNLNQFRSSQAQKRGETAYMKWNQDGMITPGILYRTLFNYLIATISRGNSILFY
jgi:hypothetical protein